jgi:hypothetical protein
MTQLILGAALGSILGHGLLFGIGRLFASPRGEELRTRVQLPPLRVSVLIAGFIKYAGALGAGVALITLGVWAVEDYLGARAVRSVSTANIAEPSAPTSAVEAHDWAEASPTLPPSSATITAAASSDSTVDPYNDSDFKVHRKPHRPGTPLSLKETLVQRSEAKARADLLREMQQRVSRSQYDCEAAEHADRYLKADLDVWGFSAWQLRYFPLGTYQGAMLPQCRDIETVVEHSGGFAANR